MYVSLCFHSINHLDRYFYFTTLETIPQALIIKISRKLSILNSTENKRRAYDTATYRLILTDVERRIRRYLLKYLTCRITGLSPKISNYQRCRDIQSFLSSWGKTRERRRIFFTVRTKQRIERKRKRNKRNEMSRRAGWRKSLFKEHRSSSKSPVRSASWIRLVHHQHFR